MWERFKFWLSGQKDCNGCCLGCSYYAECSSDIVYEQDAKEAYERDLLIEAIIRERILGRRDNAFERKSA